MTKLKPKKSKFRSGRKTLFIISALLLSSAAIRIAVGANGAIALESAALPEATEMPDTGSGLVASFNNCEPSEHLTEILEELSEREARIVVQEKEIRDRSATLRIVEKEIRKNLLALERAETELSKTIALADSAAENDLAQLTTVYENMKPKNAAKLFQEMPPEFAAGFLGRMRPDAAAAIMAGLDASAAYSISVVLAGRNANIPKE